MLHHTISTVIYVLLLLVSPTLATDEYTSPETVAGARTIDTAQAKALFDQGVVFVDMRADADWEAGRIPNAIHLELLHTVFTQPALSKMIDNNQQVVIYCNGSKCPRSSTAAAQSSTWGFTNVHDFRLGFPAWQAAGHAIE